MDKQLLLGVGYKVLKKLKFLNSRESKGTTKEALVMRVDEQP